jgi:hypothetical protein
MHLLTTDRLACPRCGPAFGLILLADRVVDRRVLEGRFGCANCRERFPVRGGFGDFRVPPVSPLAEDPRAADPGPDDPEGALRLAAMLGITEGPATLLLLGGPARQAERLVAMVPGIDVVAVHPGLRERPEEEGVSRLHVGVHLPFFSATFRGVAMDASWAASHLDEALRVAVPGARIVVELQDAAPTGADPAQGGRADANRGEVDPADAETRDGEPARSTGVPTHRVMEALGEVLLQTERMIVGVR